MTVAVETFTNQEASIIDLCEASGDINNIIIPRIVEECGMEPDYIKIWDIHRDTKKHHMEVIHIAADFYLLDRKMTMQAEWVPGSDPFEWVDFWIKPYGEVWGT